MRLPVISRSGPPAFRAWGLLALIFLAAPVWAASLTVTQPNQQIYAEPAFTSPAVGPVPQGARVNVIREQGDWFKVDYQGKMGWMHKGALSQAATPAMGLPGLLTGGPVKEAKSDEVALAGKGFTPEVEAGFRQKNPSLNYAQVDQIEGFQVDPGRLQAFLREGGLNP